MATAEKLVGNSLPNTRCHTGDQYIHLHTPLFAYISTPLQ